MIEKEWWESKTHWFNIMIGIFGVIELNVHLLQNAIGDNYGYLVIAIGVIGVILRNVTTTPIKKKNDKSV